MRGSDENFRGPLRSRSGLPAALLSPAAWLGATSLCLDLVVGPTVGSVLLALVIVALALVPALGLGLLLLPVVLGASVLLARLERRRLSLLLDLQLPDPPAATGPWHRRLRSRLDPMWRELAHHVLGILRGPLLAVPVLAVATAAAAGLFAPVLRLLVDDDAWLVAGPVGWLVAAGMFLGGLILALAWPYVVEACVAVARAEAVLLLGPRRSDLQARVEVLTRTRSAALEAADAERRRIERDLHDGAQQRLVALAMDLGRARARLASDPDRAAALLDDVHREAMTALAELRDLARGIAPSVLTDRGLDAALSALAARSPVPVEVDVEPAQDRLDRTAESVAYFCVAEALTNIAKHAGASSARVVVRRPPGLLHVEVYDDGVGGAAPSSGSGLAGLRDRVQAVDGRLCVQSPPGGPTLLRVELPCAS